MERAQIAAMPGNHKSAEYYARATAEALLDEAEAAEAQARATWRRAATMRAVARAERTEGEFGSDPNNAAVRDHYATFKEQQTGIVETEARLFEIEAQRLRAQAAVAQARTRDISSLLASAITDVPMRK